MSGSSYDGIDVSYVQTNGKNILRKDLNFNFNYSHKSIKLIKKFLTNPLFYANQKKKFYKT